MAHSISTFPEGAVDNTPHAEQVQTAYRLWTEDEEKFLLDNWTSLTITQLSAKLQRSPLAVNRKLHALHTIQTDRKLRQRRWTANEEKFLVENSACLRVNQLSKALNRSSNGINTKMRQLGLKPLPKQGMWTKLEEEFLLNNINFTDRQIGDSLGRSTKKVKEKLRRIRRARASQGLSIPRRNIHLWTATEVDYLRHNSGRSIPELSEVLGIPENKVRSKLYNLSKNGQPPLVEKVNGAQRGGDSNDNIKMGKAGNREENIDVGQDITQICHTTAESSMGRCMEDIGICDLGDGIVANGVLAEGVLADGVVADGVVADGAPADGTQICHIGAGSSVAQCVEAIGIRDMENGILADGIVGGDIWTTDPSFWMCDMTVHDVKGIDNGNGNSIGNVGGGFVGDRHQFRDSTVGGGFVGDWHQFRDDTVGGGFVGDWHQLRDDTVGGGFVGDWHQLRDSTDMIPHYQGVLDPSSMFLAGLGL